MIELGSNFFRQIPITLRDFFRGKKNEAQIFYLRESSWPRRDLPWYSRTPQLTPDEIGLLNTLRHELCAELGPEQMVSENDVLRLALEDLRLKFGNGEREDVLLRLRFYLWATRQDTTDRSA